MECTGMHPLFPDDPKREGNCRRKMDTCGLAHNASICSAELRTYNTAAACHGPEDWYALHAVNICCLPLCVCSSVGVSLCVSVLRIFMFSSRYEFTPWRAPGSAPVFDSCGVAGGRPPPAGNYGAQYYNTSHASQGDHGSKVLKPAPSGVVLSPG